MGADRGSNRTPDGSRVRAGRSGRTRDAEWGVDLSYPDMADLNAERGLTRAQMELVAARVSYLNDCLF